MAIKKRNLDESLIAWIQTQTGLPVGTGDLYYVAATAAWRQFLIDQGYTCSPYSNPKTAYDACTTNRNDTVIVFPGTYDPGDVWTWSKSYTHMIGVGPVGIMQHPVKIGHSLGTGEATGQFKLTGSGCMFFNITFEHTIDTGTTQGVINVAVSGSDNTFDHVHFLNMNDTASADEAGMKGVLIGGNDNVYRKCVFGGTEQQRTDGAADMTLDTAGSQNNVFEDCIWIANLNAAADGDHLFIEGGNSACVTNFMLLDRPTFVNAGGLAALPAAMSIAAGTGEILMRDPLLGGGITALVGTGDTSVWILPQGLDSEGNVRWRGGAINPDTA